jgi:UV DNA damage repair endonuclease
VTRKGGVSREQSDRDAASRECTEMSEEAAESWERCGWPKAFLSSSSANMARTTALMIDCDRVVKQRQLLSLSCFCIYVAAAASKQWLE